MAEFRGTSAYASHHAHDREELCPRDDIYSAMFVFVDLLCGRLPWSDHCRKKAKESVAAMKRQMVASDPQLLVAWMEETISRDIVVCSNLLFNHTSMNDVLPLHAIG